MRELSDVESIAARLGVRLLDFPNRVQSATCAQLKVALRNLCGRRLAPSAFQELESSNCHTLWNLHAAPQRRSVRRLSLGRLLVKRLEPIHPQQGAHDAADAADDPGTVYGPILDLGTSIIQTDRPELLIRYLDSSGRHTLP